MRATLPARLYPEAASARFLVHTAIQTTLATIPVHLSDTRDLPRGLRFRLVPKITPDMRTPKGRLRRKNGAPLPTPYTRLNSRQTRRVNAVCWHGHRDFMLTLFNLLPDLTLYTALATYRGRDHFLSTHNSTRYHNHGSTFSPAQYDSLCCDC